MPSFQTRLKITGLRPGNPPEAVMDTAVEALGTRHHVEAHQLQLAGGVPQLNLRFLVDATEYSGENRQARDSAAMMRDAVERVALTGALTVLRRSPVIFSRVWKEGMHSSLSRLLPHTPRPETLSHLRREIH